MLHAELEAAEHAEDDDAGSIQLPAGPGKQNDPARAASKPHSCQAAYPPQGMHFDKPLAPALSDHHSGGRYGPVLAHTYIMVFTT